MRLTNFLRPERAFASAAKLFLGLFVLVIGASALVPWLACLEFSRIEALGTLVGVALLSVAAYLVREHRKGERSRPRSIRGAERTPLLPRIQEDE